MHGDSCDIGHAQLDPPAEPSEDRTYESESLGRIATALRIPFWTLGVLFVCDRLLPSRGITDKTLDFAEWGILAIVVSLLVFASAPIDRWRGVLKLPLTWI